MRLHCRPFRLQIPSQVLQLHEPCMGAWMALAVSKGGQILCGIHLLRIFLATVMPMESELPMISHETWKSVRTQTTLKQSKFSLFMYSVCFVCMFCGSFKFYSKVFMEWQLSPNQGPGRIAWNSYDVDALLQVFFQVFLGPRKTKPKNQATQRPKELWTEWVSTNNQGETRNYVDE